MQKVVLATVISAGPEHFVIDAGMKSLSPDQGAPGIDGMTFESVNQSEEHTAFYGLHNLKVGDLVKVIPGHGPLSEIAQERTTNPFLQPFNEPYEE